MKKACSGSITKTSFCEADGCEKSWTGDPRTVNKRKEIHLKVCTFIYNDRLLDELLNRSSLNTLSPSSPIKNRCSFTAVPNSNAEHINQ